MRFFMVVLQSVALTWTVQALSPKRASQFIDSARELLGVRYDLGGRLRSSGEGIDCQGVLFYAAERIGPCSWKSYSTMPTKSVVFKELGVRVPGLDPIASSDLDIKKLLPGDVILFVDYFENPAEPAIGKIGDKEVWVIHTGLYSGQGHVIEADFPAVIETDLRELLTRYSYAGIFVTRMEKGPKPKRCRWNAHMPKPNIESIIASEIVPTPTKANGHSYDEVLAMIKSSQERLQKAFLSAKSAPEQNSIRTIAKKQVIHTIVDGLIPFWLGTPWAWGENDDAERPFQEGIACHKFVLRILQQVGLQIPDEGWFAQRYAIYMMRSLAPSIDDVRSFSGVNAGQLSTLLQELPHGLYLLGLNCHVGFLVIGVKEPRFVHSNYLDPQSGVVDEPVASSQAVIKSSQVGYWVTPLFQDQRLVDFWLKGETVLFQRLGVPGMWDNETN